MNNIKLVIWDLDETFWQGTLSEGSVEVIEENIHVVKELTNRGIINSIVSKNDFAQAKNYLIEIGMWDYFVFPQIAWRPKGELVQTVISECQLRSPNVLFLDDNHSNLSEVVFYNKGISAEEPAFLPGILNHSSFAGKDDRDHSRLKQYKILESKAVERQTFSTNTEFLRASNIRIQIENPLESDSTERIHELLARANQLNFTKVRLSKEATDSLLKDPGFESRAIRVFDDFGDYGIAGFYCLDRSTQSLQHFVFSCRILNLGVEHYLYDYLNQPEIKIVPSVASSLVEYESPDWITEVSQKEDSSAGKKQRSRKNLKVFFKGGCDLLQMLFYLEPYNLEIIREMNYVAENGLPLHNEHSEIILDSARLDDKEKAYFSEHLPFIDESSYSSQIFEGDTDVVIYSVLMDYTQILYQHKDSGHKVSFGGYALPELTSLEDHSRIFDHFLSRGVSAFTLDVLDEFSQEYTCLGLITPKDFKENLKAIRSRVPNSTPILFVNGAEVQSKMPEEEHAKARHEAMNKALEEFIDSSENCFLLDVRKRVLNPNDLIDNIRHYNRIIYHEIANDLIEFLNIQSPWRIEKEWTGSTLRHELKVIAENVFGPRITSITQRIRNLVR